VTSTHRLALPVYLDIDAVNDRIVSAA
jgi:hypothetical protein